MSVSSMSGMDSMGMTGQQGAMTAYLHFTPLMDTIWFQYWVPTSPAAVLGTCIGLFLLSILDRWIAACRSVAEVSWSQSALLASRLKAAERALAEKSEKSEKSSTGSKPPISKPPSFLPSRDISRGILQATQAALEFLFMLASMTFQAAFIISMCVGAGVGEMMFGRYITASSSHH